MTKVYKIQRPIETNDEDPRWLIYDETRTEVYEMPYSLVPEIMRDIWDDPHWSPTGFKVYARMGIHKKDDNSILIDSFQLVEPENW